MSSILDRALDPERLALCAMFDALDAQRDNLPDYSSAPSVLERIGRWVAWHYRGLALESGTQTAARQLRKQGYPLEVALLILVPGAPDRAPRNVPAEADSRPVGAILH